MLPKPCRPCCCFGWWGIWYLVVVCAFCVQYSFVYFIFMQFLFCMSCRTPYFDCVALPTYFNYFLVLLRPPVALLALPVCLYFRFIWIDGNCNLVRNFFFRLKRNECRLICRPHMIFAIYLFKVHFCFCSVTIGDAINWLIKIAIAHMNSHAQCITPTAAIFPDWAMCFHIPAVPAISVIHHMNIALVRLVLPIPQFRTGRVSHRSNVRSTTTICQVQFTAPCVPHCTGIKHLVPNWYRVSRVAYYIIVPKTGSEAWPGNYDG